MAERNLAAFDFDGTLTRRDTLVPFLRASRGSVALAGALARIGPAAARARLHSTPEHHHRDVTKELLLRALFRGRDAGEAVDAGRTFARTIPDRLRPEMLDKLRWHQSEGHEVVLVSASLLLYLEPFAAEFGIDHTIGVGLEVENGKLTGALTGPNVRGPEKAVRLKAWLGDRPATRLWAYGNSSGDDELLAMATDPLRV